MTGILYTLIVTFLIFATFSKKALMAKIVVAVCLLSNFVSLLIYYVDPSSKISYIIATREIVIITSFFLVVIFLKKFKWPFKGWIDYIFLILLILFSTFIIVSSFKYGVSALISGRDILFPVLVYFLFRLIRLDQISTERLVNLIVIIAIISSSVSIFEFVYVNFVNPSFWESINMSGYLSQKYGTKQEIPMSWYNFLPLFIGLPPTVRTIGIMTDPIVNALFSTCSFALAYYWLKGWKKVATTLVILSGIATTASKASVIILIVVIANGFLMIKPRNLGLLAFTSLYMLGLVFGIIILSIDDKSFTHLGSFYAGVDALLTNPVGKGLGSTGYTNFLITSKGTISVIDTAFSLYAYQMGVLGFLSLVALIIIPAIVLAANLTRLNTMTTYQKKILLSTSSIFIPYSVLIFLNSAILTFIPSLIPFLLISIYQTNIFRSKTTVCLQETTQTNIIRESTVSLAQKQHL